MIFEEEEDYQKMLQIIKDCKAISEFELYAYCLMGNHLHLLIREGKEKLSQIFKRICTRYVYWYNIKYQRVGHLFQDRFKSEPVENDEYFLTVLRYIHQNPLKANICKKIEDYSYSSYNEYITQRGIVDRDFVFGIVAEDEFISYNHQDNIDKCIDVEETTFIRVTDEEALRIIKKISKCNNITEFQHLSESERKKYVKKLKDKGLSIRQISRLTGASKGIVEKYLKA